MRKLLTILALTAALVVATAGESSAQWRNNGGRGRVVTYAPVISGYNGIQAYTPYANLYGNTYFGTTYASPIYNSGYYNTGIYSNAGYHHHTPYYNTYPTYNTGVYQWGNTNQPWYR